MATGELVEEIADQIEEVTDVTRRITGRDMGLVFSGSCIGIAGGIAIGYFLTKSRLETKYEQIAQEEIANLREHYLQKIKAAEEKPNLEEMVETLGYSRPEEEEKEEDDSDEDESAVEPEQDPRPGNVFDIPQPETPEWDYAAEAKKRDSHHPYVIHKDEYDKNETGYDQLIFAYYEDDDVLANDRDGVVDTQVQDGLVPPDFVNKFGYGSGDPNVVYVRCAEASVEIQIVRNDGNYGEVVHGFLRHSDERGRRRKPHFDDE